MWRDYFINFSAFNVKAAVLVFDRIGAHLSPLPRCAPQQLSRSGRTTPFRSERTIFARARLANYPPARSHARSCLVRPSRCTDAARLQCTSAVCGPRCGSHAKRHSLLLVFHQERHPQRASCRFPPRTASTTWRIASITSWGCSFCISWPLFVLVTCLAPRTRWASFSCASFCAVSVT
jgi:hypothetical protein